MLSLSHLGRALAMLLLLALGTSANGDSSEDSSRAWGKEVWRVLQHANDLCFAPTAIQRDSAVSVVDSARRLAIGYFGPTDTLVARMTFGLGIALKIRGEYDSAAHAFEQSIRLWQVSLGKDCPKQAGPLRLLGLVRYVNQHRFAEGEAAYQRAIQLLTGYEDSDFTPEILGWCLFNLGDLRLDLGHPDEAESYYRQAFAIWQDRFGDTSALVSAALAQIGGFMSRSQKKHAEALAMLQQASRYFQTNPDRRAYWVGPVQVSLESAHALYGLGRDDEAKAELDQVVRMPNANILQSAAGIEQEFGHCQRAIVLYEQSLDRRNWSNDPDTAALSATHLDLGRCLLATGDTERSLSALSEGLRLRLSFLKNELSRASEVTKLQYVWRYKPIVEDLLTLAIRAPSNRTIESSLLMTLCGKAVVLDELVAEREAATCADNPAARDLLNRHAAVCDAIAAAAAWNVGTNSARQNATGPGELAPCYRTKDSLELVLSQICGPLTTSSDSLLTSPNALCSALPENSVLWEFVRFRPVDYEHAGSVQPVRYAAFTLDPNGHATISDLGEADVIDSLVAALHQKVQEGSRVLVGADERMLEKELSGVSSQLTQRVLRPLLDKSEDCHRILVSPDGQLSVLPFEILLLPDGRYAIEQYEFSYLSSGRDLLRYNKGRTGNSTGAVVVAAPDFDGDSQRLPAQIASAPSQVASRQVRGPSDRSACLSVPFDPLPASEDEGRSIAELLRAGIKGKADLLAGPNATEDTLKHWSPPPRVLHLATHSYSCTKASYSDMTAMSESPLLYSGLALVGSNRTIEDPGSAVEMKQDGILTSLEVTGLNLVGTELVVLSSCRAGQGQVLAGEGVFGLRRAFQLAGARSVVMSMFDVPDVTARDLMTHFYRDWMTGTSKSKALRNAMLAELVRCRDQKHASHPLFWGGFVLTGDYR